LLIRMDDYITIIGSITLILIILLCLIEYFKERDVIDNFYVQPVQPPVQQPVPVIEVPVPKACNTESDCPIRFKCASGICVDKRPGKR
jgi:hypothetical protein